MNVTIMMIAHQHRQNILHCVSTHFYPPPPLSHTPQIESLVPFITGSRLSLTLDDLVLVLKEPNPLSTHLTMSTQHSLSQLGECA